MTNTRHSAYAGCKENHSYGSNHEEEARENQRYARRQDEEDAGPRREEVVRTQKRAALREKAALTRPGKPQLTRS